jgi:hypothetical protein
MYINLHQHMAEAPQSDVASLASPKPNASARVESSLQRRSGDHNTKPSSSSSDCSRRSPCSRDRSPKPQPVTPNRFGKELS